MKTTLIKISDDGLSGQVVNPFEEYSKEWVKLEHENNLPYPLTEPAEPGKEVEAVLVWKTRKDTETKIWVNVDNGILKLHNGNYIHYCKISQPDLFQQFFEVISNKEEPTIEEMVKHTMDRMPALDGVDELREKTNCYFCNGTGKQYANTNSCEWTCRYCNGTGFQEQPVAEQSIEKLANEWCKSVGASKTGVGYSGFMACYHILNAKGLVSKDRVVEIIEKLFTDHAGFSQYSKNYLINQIKDSK